MAQDVRYAIEIAGYDGNGWSTREAAQEARDELIGTVADHYDAHVVEMDPGPGIDELVAGKVPGIRMARETYHGTEPPTPIDFDTAVVAAEQPETIGCRFDAPNTEEGKALIRDVTRLVHERLQLRLPAPAWTREPPKHEGFWWTRDGAGSTPIVSEWTSGVWLDCGVETWNENDAREHWPVRVEPPK